MSMKVLVTGATGTIGFEVARALRRAGHRVYGLHRSAESARRLEAAEIVPVRGDLGDLEAASGAARECRVFVHAAMDGGPDAVALDRKAVETLVRWTKTSTRPSPRIVYTSGVWVYGPSGSEPVDEGSPLHPPDLVSWRPAHERLVLDAAEGHVGAIVLRPGCVYGGRGSLTSAWFESAARRGAVEIVGDGKNRWSNVHLDDLADAYVRAAESVLERGIVNVVGSTELVEDMARAAARAAGVSEGVLSLPLEEARRTLGPLADCLAMSQDVLSDKADRLFGWRPRHGAFTAGADLYHASWRAAAAQAGT